jgi:spore photoproduct lyase
MIEEVTRKSLKIRPSGRSSDFISPSFGWGCLYNCSYCYMKRHKPKGLSIAKNTSQILTEINTHAVFAKHEIKKPNQTHPEYLTYDISCNEDFALHAKYHNWREIFNFFKNHDDILGTFATKYVNPKLLEYNPKGKIRIRFSMMPENKRKLHEPNTSTIMERIKAVDKFKEAGYDVHLNFSPIIVYKGWLDDYEELFTLINNNISNKIGIFAECIFLTHNKDMHFNNIIDGRIKEEEDLWRPEMQEGKTSQYGGKNVRYKYKIKKEFIDAFIREHDSTIPWNKIRYIF